MKKSTSTIHNQLGLPATIAPNIHGVTYKKKYFISIKIILW